MASKGRPKEKPAGQGAQFPEAAIPASPAMMKRFRAKALDESAMAHKGERKNADEAAAGLKYLGRNWDGQVRETLGIPDALFFQEGPASRHYSSDQLEGSGALIRWLGMNRLIVPRCGYCITLYEKADAVYFVLFDAKRRIVVRDVLINLMENPAERDWREIASCVRFASELAQTEEAKKGKLFAVSDGATLKLMKPEGAESPETMPRKKTA